MGGVGLKRRAHFAFTIELLDDAGEIEEHVAGIENLLLAREAFAAACRLWPKRSVMLRRC
jgi:hypothetical protein